MSDDPDNVGGFWVGWEDVINDDYDPADPDSEVGWRTFDVGTGEPGHEQFSQLQYVEQHGHIDYGNGIIIPVPPEIIEKLVARARAVGGYDG